MRGVVHDRWCSFHSAMTVMMTIGQVCDVGLPSCPNQAIVRCPPIPQIPFVSTCVYSVEALWSEEYPAYIVFILFSWDFCISKHSGCDRWIQSPSFQVGSRTQGDFHIWRVHARYGSHPFHFRLFSHQIRYPSRHYHSMRPR